MKRKIISAIMATSLAVTALFTTTASAETWTNKEVFKMKKGEKENIRITGGFGSVQWAKVEPGGIVQVIKAGPEGIDVQGIAAGTTEMTISSIGTDENGKWQDHTGKMKITVVDDYSPTNPGEELGLASHVGVANFTLEVGKSLAGASHRSISTVPVVTPSNILSATKGKVTVDTANDPAAAAAASLGINTSNGEAITYTGLVPGMATITYMYRDEGSSIDQKATITVRVVSAEAAAAEAAAAATTTSITLPMGSGSKLSQNYYMIADLKSGNPSIVSAMPSGTTGGMNINMKALKIGVSAVTFKYKMNSNNEDWQSTTLNITVKEDDTKKEVESDSKTGIYLTPRASNAKVGKKSYRSVVRINGEKLDDNSKEWENLRWISTDPKVAKMDENGWFTIVGKGSARIVCISRDGEMMDSMKVTGK